ncbi:MAG: TonB-dependent receptor [Ferruginibacter sp.]
MKKKMKGILSKLTESIALTIVLLVFSIAASAQTVVTGKVTDSKKGTGIPGVTVSVKGKGTGTQTGSDGGFKINVPAGATTLTFTSVGYTTQEVAIGSGDVNVQLVENTQQLSDVVVVGYGTARKRDLTGSVATVSSKDFNKGVITTPEQLIAGKVAGVSVTPNDGAPGSGSTIRIRGGSSLNASNDPLIVIDGMPIQNPKNPDGSNSVPGVANPLALINPNDIATFTILKDASATAIYGSRASNGVIIITTKKGQSGKAKFAFSSQVSVAKLAKKVDVLSAQEFRDLVNANGTAAQKALLGNVSTDWQDQIYQNALVNDNNLSVSGAVKRLPYRISLGYLNQEGILKTGKLERITTGLNLSPSLLGGNLKIDLNVKGSFTKTRFANTDAVWGANQFDPTQPVYSGNNRFGGYWERLDPSNTNTGLTALSPKNPLGLLMQKNDRGNANRLIANLGIDYKLRFFPDLRVVVNGGYDYANGYGNVVINDSAASNYKAFTSGDGSVHGGTRTQYKTKVTNSYLNGYLNYSKNFDAKNRIELMAGAEYQDYLTTNYNFKAYAYDTAVTNYPQYPFDKPQNRLLSYLGRLNYTFNNALFITASIRRDGSSKFGPNNRWGTFPSAAVAWRLNEIPALRNSKALSNLKLRIGYGVTGQQDGIGNYDYISYYGLSNDKAQYQIGDKFYQMFRPGGYYQNRKWEQTATSNIAIDYGFFNNRISGSIEYYYRKTTDLLNLITQPAFTNFSNTTIANVGSMVNKGVEFSINAQPVVSKDFNWDVAFNVTYNKNEITKLTINDIPGFVNQIAGIGGNGGVQANAIGNPRASFYVFKQIYDKTTGLPIENLYEDFNRDGVINSSDLVIFKSPDPKMFFGFSSNLTYKKLSLGFNLRANVGNYVYNNVATNGAISKFLFASYLSNQSSDVLNTKFQGTGNFYQSDYYVQNASFLRMDNINLGYNLGKIGNNVSLRFNAGVQNVFVITKYKGLDPEISGGIDNNAYPRPRTFIFGVGLDF